MLNRFKSFIRDNYFGRQFSLDYRVYMIFFFESFVISVLSAITNTMLGKGLPGLILQWSYVGFCTFLLVAVPRIRQALQKPHLLFITFFYIPFLYFQTAGYDGTALLFAQLGLFLLGIVFSERARILIITANIIEYLICILISYQYPQTVVPHSGPHAQLIDLMMALVLSFIGISVLTVYVDRIFSDNNNALAELSIRDALTGAYNRRYLIECLQYELDIAKESGNRIYVMMLDIDHFKQINDNYGHGFGDQVLLACVQEMQNALRKGGILARYGGEEFAIILHPRMPIEAIAIAERIRQAVSSLQFEIPGVRVTISIGVEKSQSDDSVEELLERADQCLYQAKQSGRNQVVPGSRVSSAFQNMLAAEHTAP